MAITANVSGELRELYGVPDGTTGRLIVMQRGLLSNPGQGHDGFPVEFIKIRPIGNHSM